MREAGYHHSFVEGYVDMHGITIAAEVQRTDPEPAVRPEILTTPDGQPYFSFPKRSADEIGYKPRLVLRTLKAAPVWFGRASCWLTP